MCKKILWNDLETGGADSKKHAVLQIAAVIEIDGKIVDQFESKVRPFPGKIATDEALEVTGFTREEIETFPKPTEVMQRFDSFLARHGQRKNKAERYIMAGYNNGFDNDFLSQWYADITGGPYAYWDFLQFSPIDPLPICRAMRMAGIIDTPDTKLGTLCNYFGIPIKAHDALSDVLATRELTHKVYGDLFTAFKGTPWGILGVGYENKETPRTVNA